MIQLNIFFINIISLQLILVILSEMDPPKQQQIPIENIEEEQSEPEQEVSGKNKQILNDRMLNAAKKNDIQQVEKCLKKKADINFQQTNSKKKWNALIWASCSGHIKMVKLLISKGAAAQYLQSKPENRHVVLGTNKQMKPNPLHWACFKGNLEVFYILIKTGIHWQDVDSCGNNSVMLAVAGNSLEIFRAFLQIGVPLDCHNTRGHTVKDLTTNEHILSLASKYNKSKECHISKIAFKQKQIKHFCWVCENFVNSDHYRLEWVLLNLNATEKQKIDGRCTKCWGEAAKIQKDLEQAITAYEQIRLHKTIQSYKDRHKQIQITFLSKCQKLKHKLSLQNQILDYIKSLAKIDNYRQILKSVNKIHKMLHDASPYHIDEDVVAVANREIQRLNAERNLRFQIDNIDTSVATRQGVAKLQEVYSTATQSSVAGDYLEVANEIKTKMNKSILAQDIHQLFSDYPVRPDPYPDPLVIDFKTKKPLDPATKKPTDPANLLPKKKKVSKKTPGFVIPDWATELKQMNEKIVEQQGLLVMKNQLGLSEQFVHQAHDMVVLMKKESRYRKDMDTLQAMVDQANKKKK